MNKAMMTKKESPLAVVGIQDYDPKDLILPRVLLMQGLSKFVQENGKKAGEFVNSLTKETMENIVFTPIVISKYFDVLKPEGTRMIFDYRVTEKNDPRLIGKRFFTNEEGPSEVKTVLAAIVLINHQPFAIAFAKKSYRAGKKLLTLAVLSQGPVFWKKYSLKTEKETNKHGTFYVMDVEEIGETDKEERQEGQNYFTALGSKTKEVHQQDADKDTDDVPF